MLLFLTGIVIAPGRFETVMFGGMFSIAGVVLSIIGIVANRGRTAGIFALVFFVVAWIVNGVLA